MKNKISVRLFLIQWIFLLLVAGCCALCYKVFFPLYYNWIRDKQINEAYLDIGDLDLANLEEKDYSVFAGYEDENLSFTISDENMNPIYTTRDNPEYYVYKNIEMKMDLFSENPKIIQRDSKLKETTKMRGIITQNDINYYIVIKDVISGIGTTPISEQFLAIMVAAMLILTGVSIFRISRYLSRPLEHLALVADRMAEGNFEEQAKEEGEFQEVSQIAQSINRMAVQLQQSRGQIDENRNQQLRQNVRQERVDKLRKDFIANVSHELKTPLAVISSQAEMIEYVGEEDRKCYLASIQEEVVKMSEMVRSLLDISVMEHNMESMLQKKLDMKDVMEYILMKYDGLMKKKKLHMTSFLEEDCLVYGDREYIEQAVNNYMMNALEHAELGGSIRVTLRKQKTDIRIGVYNTGKQVPMEEMEHIWNGFYTKKHKEVDAFSHAGLGLYIVQSVVTMHNGKYGVENLPEGVEFWFTLPQAAEE